MWMNVMHGAWLFVHVEMVAEWWYCHVLEGSGSEVKWSTNFEGFLKCYMVLLTQLSRWIWLHLEFCLWIKVFILLCVFAGGSLVRCCWKGYSYILIIWNGFDMLGILCINVLYGIIWEWLVYNRYVWKLLGLDKCIGMFEIECMGNWIVLKVVKCYGMFISFGLLWKWWIDIMCM